MSRRGNTDRLGVLAGGRAGPCVLRRRRRGIAVVAVWPAPCVGVAASQDAVRRAFSPRCGRPAVGAHLAATPFDAAHVAHKSAGRVRARGGSHLCDVQRGLRGERSASAKWPLHGLLIVFGSAARLRVCGSSRLGGAGRPRLRVPGAKAGHLRRLAGDALARHGCNSSAPSSRHLVTHACGRIQRAVGPGWSRPRSAARAEGHDGRDVAAVLSGGERWARA